MPNEQERIMLAGSRSLPYRSQPIIRGVVEALLAQGRSLVLGCASGADEAALQTVLAAGVLRQARVHAAFGPGGAGGCHWSAVVAVNAFNAGGGEVIWWAGGGNSVPLSMRLAARTQSVVATASGLVVFFSRPDSRGSRLACRLAVARGLPVVAFPLGFQGSILPTLGNGAWYPCQRAGVWGAAWRWIAAQERMF